MAAFLRFFHFTAKTPSAVRQFSSLYLPAGGIRSLREYASKLAHRELEIKLVRESNKKLIQDEARSKTEENAVKIVGSVTRQRRAMEKNKKKTKKALKMKMMEKQRPEDVEMERKLMAACWKKLKR